MSSVYHHYILPGIAGPLSQELARMAQDTLLALSRSGWCGDSARLQRLSPRGVRVPDRLRVSLDGVREAVLGSPEWSWLISAGSPPQEPGSEAESLFWQCPPGTPLSRAFCTDVALLVCPKPAAVPFADDEGYARCRQCGADLFEDSGALTVCGLFAAAEAFLWPETCPACGSSCTTGLVDWTLKSPLDGTTVQEAPALFNLAVRLSSDAPPQFPAVTAAGLLDALFAVTGSAPRVTGRYG